MLLCLAQQQPPALQVAVRGAHTLGGGLGAEQVQLEVRSIEHKQETPPFLLNESRHF